MSIGNMIIANTLSTFSLLRLQIQTREAHQPAAHFRQTLAMQDEKRPALESANKGQSQRSHSGKMTQIGRKLMSEAVNNHRSPARLWVHPSLLPH